MALTLDLNLSAPRSSTGSGTSGSTPSFILLTEAGEFLLTEAGENLRYNVPPILITEANQNLLTESNFSIST